MHGEGYHGASYLTDCFDLSHVEYVQFPWHSDLGLPKDHCSCSVDYSYYLGRSDLTVVKSAKHHLKQESKTN